MSTNKEKEAADAEKAVFEDDHSKRQKFWTTVAIFYGNLTYGCAMNAFSPSLTDFKQKFDADTATISVVFTASIGCYMVGALVCSFIYNFMNRQLAVIILFAGISATMFLAPHVPSLTTFYVMGGILGFCIGCYDTAQFVWIMEMWQSKSGPLIQAQHFCFAVGTVLSPVLMSPFLTKEEDGEEESSTTVAPEDVENNKRLFVPFTIIGCLCSITMISQCLLFIFLRYKAPPPEYKGEVSEKQLEKRTGNIIERLWPGWSVARLVILSMLTLGFYQGMEMSTMQLFPQFGQESELKLSESEAANTLTGLTVAFAVGRAIAIPLVFRVPPQYILFVDIGIVAVANIVLIIWGNTSLTMLWTSSILYGLGFSSLLPAFCAYMERHLIFTNTIGAMMIVSGSCVGACYPLIIGGFIEKNPLVLTYPIFFSLGVVICAVSISYWITHLKKKR